MLLAPAFFLVGLVIFWLQWTVWFLIFPTGALILIAIVTESWEPLLFLLLLQMGFISGLVLMWIRDIFD